MVLLRHFPIMLVIWLCTDRCHAQHLYPMWHDEDALHSAFEHCPAYRTDSKYTVALFSNYTTHVSDVRAPLFYMDARGLETNTSLWLRSGTGDSKVGLFGEVRPTSIGELFDGSMASGDPHYLSHHSTTLLAGIAISDRAAEIDPSESSWRLGVSTHRQVDFQYDDRFSDFVRNADFRTAGRPVSAIGDVSLRYMAYYSLDVGRSVEIRPLRTTVGGNIHLLLGTDYVFARTAPSADQLLLRRSGYDFNRGFLDPNDRGVDGYGASFDLGVVHRLHRRLSLNASLVDIGSIRWRDYEKDALFSDAEIVLGVSPLSNVFPRYDGATYEQALDGATSLVSASQHEAQGVWSDGSLRAGATYEGEVHSLYFSWSEGVNRRDIRPDARQLSLRYEAAIHAEYKTGLALGAGADLGSDSGSAFSMFMTARHGGLRMFVSVNGLFDGNAPYSRQLLLFSLQLDLSKGFSVDRI